MIEILFGILTLLGVQEPRGEMKYCELQKDSFCCVWQYEEVGCYDYFEVRESWCLSEEKNRLAWVYSYQLRDLKTIEESTYTYTEEDCKNCPECCSEDWDDMQDDQEEFLRYASPEEREAVRRLWNE